MDTTSTALVGRDPDSIHPMTDDQRALFNAASAAAKEGRAEDLARLIETAQRNGQRLWTRTYSSLILWATESASTETLQVLLDHGWNINMPQAWSEPPFLGKVVHDHHLVRWFLDHGADPNMYAGVLPITPLSRAVQHASFNTVKLLFEHGGSATRGQLVYFTCLRRTDDPCTLPILRLLVEKGAPVNDLRYEDVPELRFQTVFEIYPLMCASSRGNVDAVRLLLENGADPRKKLLIGTSLPIDAARDQGFEEVVEVLSEAMEQKTTMHNKCSL